MLFEQGAISMNWHLLLCLDPWNGYLQVPWALHVWSGEHLPHTWWNTWCEAGQIILSNLHAVYTFLLKVKNWIYFPIFAGTWSNWKNKKAHISSQNCHFRWAQGISLWWLKEHITNVACLWCSKFLQLGSRNKSDFANFSHDDDCMHLKLGTS